MPTGRTKKGKAKAAQKKKAPYGAKSSTPIKNTNKKSLGYGDGKGSVTLSRGKAKKVVKKYSIAEAINMSNKK